MWCLQTKAKMKWIMAVKAVKLALCKKADVVLRFVESVGNSSECVVSGWWNRDSGPSVPGRSLELWPRLHCGFVGKAGGSIVMSAKLSNWSLRSCGMASPASFPLSLGLAFLTVEWSCMGESV